MATMLLAVGALPIATAASTCRPCDGSSRLSFSRTQSLVGGAGKALFAPSLSLDVASVSFPPVLPSVYCGRGDKKTAKGKRFKHSFGNARPRNKNKGRGPARLPAPPAPPRKDKFDDGEIIKIEIDESLFS